MIQLTDKLWAVEVPDKIDNPNFYRVNNEAIMFNWDDVDRPLNPHDLVRVDKFFGDLKDYKWPVFLFTTKTATEEDARKVVEHDDFIGGYKDYDTDRFHHEDPFIKATDSLDSLLRSKNCDPNKNYALIEKHTTNGTV